jgi:hypothetical protein
MSLCRNAFVALLVSAGGCAVADPSSDAATPVKDVSVVVDTPRPPDVAITLDTPVVPDVPLAMDIPVVSDVPVAMDTVVLPDLPVAIDASIPDVPRAVDAVVIADVPVDRPAPVDVPVVTTLEDWLVQDVCVSAAGELLADDPGDGCPAGATRRDLAPDDALPYHRHDQPGPGAPQGYQRKDSVPRPDLRTVHSFDFAPFGEFNPDRDGYDVVEAEGEYSSIIGTRDPTGLAQTFYGQGCRLDDGWLLLPRSGFDGAGARTATLSLVGWERGGTNFPGPCPSRYDRAATPFARRPVTFGGLNGAPSRPLEAIVVDHYGGADIPTADHLERFYFTRVYGLTRWERWENNRGTPRQEGCNGAVTEGTLRRVDCRDWTHVIPDPLPTPAALWPTPYAPSNVVRNHDFGSGRFDPWERLGASTSGMITNVSVITDGDGSHHLATNCAGECSPGQNVFQDIPRAGLNGAYRFGIRAWSEGGPGSLELVVFQRDARAAIVQRDAVTVTTRGAEALRVTSPTFTVRPETDHFRFTVYLNAPNTFHVDDAWLSR